MIENSVARIIRETGLPEKSIKGALALFNEDATIPFIARYRKEATGGLDEVQLDEIQQMYKKISELEQRRKSILKSLKQQDLLTPELEKSIRAAESMKILEDLYLPYKPKRKTKASVAREKGLEPLAERIFNYRSGNPQADAANYIDPEKGVSSAEDALRGACDIIAEMISENPEIRSELRSYFDRNAVFSSTVKRGKKDEGKKYGDYFLWQEPWKKAPSHRILAIFRGEKEGFLTSKIRPDEDDCTQIINRRYVKKGHPCSHYMAEAGDDAATRLLIPSLETEFRQELKTRADEDAIRIFRENLEDLLLAPPLGRKAVLAVDPGFRTGCKIVALDPQGKLLADSVIYPLEPHGKLAEAETKICDFMEKYRLETVAVGNGTGGKEVFDYLKRLDVCKKIPVAMVSESGASIYSASEAGRREFPDKDVTVRGAVSIGRRLQDPLSELVKLDPKTIGVGQYQHDVDQKMLRESLGTVVERCVNRVGVNLNTASCELLQYVAGLNAKAADNIVSFRNEKGSFAERKQLLQVPGIGPKAFQQSAGFLRIKEGHNPLDASAVHPESYSVVKKMALALKTGLNELIGNEKVIAQLNAGDYVTEQFGLPTVQDILEELAKPGRDPREQYVNPEFSRDINDIGDLEKDMILDGIVTNITAFGAFTDIGVHQDGLIHISEIADAFVSDVREYLSLGQKVTVRVLDVDPDRKRISLSMKGLS